MRKNINIDRKIQKRIFLAPHEIEDLRSRIRTIQFSRWRE